MYCTSTANSSTRTDAYSNYGCLGDTITLSCDDEKTIFVSSADYGQYALACDDDACCSPQAEDCTELVEENRPADWALLKVRIRVHDCRCCFLCLVEFSVERVEVGEGYNVY